MSKRRAHGTFVCTLFVLYCFRHDDDDDITCWKSTITLLYRCGAHPDACTHSTAQSGALQDVSRVSLGSSLSPCGFCCELSLHHIARSCRRLLELRMIVQPPTQGANVHVFWVRSEQPGDRLYANSNHALPSPELFGTSRCSSFLPRAARSMFLFQTLDASFAISRQVRVLCG
jgi:hypothetical protein